MLRLSICKHQNGVFRESVAKKRNTHYLRIKCVLKAYHGDNAYYVRIKSVLLTALNRCVVLKRMQKKEPS